MAQTLLASTVAELAAESENAPFDAIVVGGGTSGLTAARTLAERGRRAAVLEAGPAPFLTHISNTELRFSRALSDNVRNQVQYGPKLDDGLGDGKIFGPNFACLGGRGLFWNGAAPRFRAHDFGGWPFGLAELGPYYAWAEREFRVTHRLGATRLAASMLAALHAEGWHALPAPFAVDFAPPAEGRLSAGIASGLGTFFRASAGLVASGAIRIATATRAARILLRGAAATGVLAVPRKPGAATTETAEIRGRSVVLAAGGVESIRLAAVSGVPQAPRIGLGLQDHLFYRGFFDGPHLYGRDAAESAALYFPSSSQDTEQWEIHAPGRRLFGTDDGSAWNPAATDAYQLMVRSFAATDKRDDNRVEARAGDLGSATVHFSYSDADQARRARMQEHARRIAKALGLVARDERFADPGGSYHEAGGLDMGSDPKTSVTTPDGAFHGVPNLVCVDAAAFPRIGATNPHLTILAVARRQSETLAARL